MMLIEQTSIPASAFPVAEFREHLRLGTGFADVDVQDTVLESCLRSAVSAIEARTGKALIGRQFLQSITAWRAPGWHPIPMAPVSALISLEVIDRAGARKVVPAMDYRLLEDLTVPRLVAVGSLPKIPAGGTAELDFAAGYGADWTSVPDDLLRAVHILAADFYEYRHSGGRDGAQFPFAVNTLIERYRSVRLTAGGA